MRFPSRVAHRVATSRGKWLLFEVHKKSIPPRRIALNGQRPTSNPNEVLDANDVAGSGPPRPEVREFYISNSRVSACRRTPHDAR